jgi:hypothetical protein
VGDVHEIAAVLANGLSKFHPATERKFPAEERDIPNVGGQGTDLLNAFRRSDKEVLILAVQAAQSADDVPDVGADAKIGNPANIDGDLHGDD